jgi:copper chaperone
METTRFSIQNISCGHCVKAIQKELGELAGVASVEGDHGMKTIKVEWEAPATEDNIRATLKEINYPVSE